MASGSDIQAGHAFVRLSLKNDMASGLRRAKKVLQDFGGSVGGIGRSMMGVGTQIMGAGAAIAAPLILAVRGFEQAGSALTDMAARTGISQEALGELGHAAAQSGASLEDVEAASRKLEKNLAGNAKGFAEIGLSLEALNKMNPEERFMATADALSRIEDPGKRTAMAMELMGKSATKLLPMMEGGAAGMKAMREEAVRLGRMTNEEASLADNLGDALGRVWTVIKNTSNIVGAALAPAIIKAADATSEILINVMAWVRANGPLIRTVAMIAGGIVAAGAAIAVLGAGFVAAGAVIAGIGTVLGVVAGAIAMVLSPIGLLVAAVTAGVTAWALWTDSGKAAVAGITAMMGELFGVFTQTFSGITDALMSGDLTAAGKIAFAGLAVAGLTVLKHIRAMFGDTIGTIVSMLASGDLTGAWEFVCKNLAVIWDGFNLAIVTAFKIAVDTLIGMFKALREQAVSTMHVAAKALDALGQHQAAVSMSTMAGAIQAASPEMDRRMQGFSDLIGQVRNAALGKMMNDRAEVENMSDRQMDQDEMSLDAMQAQLDRLTGQASDNRRAQANKVRGVIDEGKENMLTPSTKGTAFGSFSADALLAMSTAGPQKQMVMEQKKAREEAKKASRELKEAVDRMRQAIKQNQVQVVG